MVKRIYIVDDDANMVKIATDLLKAEGYLVSSSTDPKAGLKDIRSNPPDLVLLDIRMPVMDGFALCREIKADPKIKHLPIIMLSIKTDPTDVVVALELGADDYIRKPYQELELLARVKAALRRRDTEPKPERVEVGPLLMDYGTYAAAIGGKSLALTPKEFDLLGFFLLNEGRVLTRNAISEKLWGVEHIPTSRAMDYHVDQLRKKLGDYGHWLKNLRGVGYRFEIDED